MSMQDVLANLFNKPEAPQQQAPAPQQQQQAPVNTPGAMDQQQQQQQATGGMPPNAQLGPDGQPVQQQQQAQPAPSPQATENDPLALFANMFDNTPKEGEDDLPPEFSISPDALNKAASSIDFTQGVDQEMLTKLSEGDLSQLPALMNHIAQQAYSQALSHGSALTGKFIDQHSQYQAKQVAPLVRQQLTDHALVDSATGENNTIDLSNPVVKQAVQATATMLQQKNPTMSPSQVAAKAKEYHIQLAATMLGANGDALAELPNLHKQQQQQQQAAATDWDEYLS